LSPLLPAGYVNLERPPLNPYSSPEDWAVLSKAGLTKPKPPVITRTKSRNNRVAY